MAKSFKETLLPQSGEDKVAFQARITAALAAKPTDKKEKAMLLATQAVAVTWNGVEGMENPYTAAMPDNIDTGRDLLVTAAVTMAQAIKKVVPTLDELANPGNEIDRAIAKHGAGLGRSMAKAVKGVVEKQAKAQADSKARGVLSEVKDPFDAMLELKDSEALKSSPAELALVEKLAPLHKEFKDIRRNILDSQKK